MVVAPQSLYSKLKGSFCAQLLGVQTGDHTHFVRWSLVRTQSQSKKKRAQRDSSFLGSGDWIRTSDLVVTRFLCFRKGVDYLINRRLPVVGRYREIIVRLTL